MWYVRKKFDSGKYLLINPSTKDSRLFSDRQLQEFVHSGVEVYGYSDGDITMYKTFKDLQESLILQNSLFGDFELEQGAATEDIRFFIKPVGEYEGILEMVSPVYLVGCREVTNGVLNIPFFCTDVGSAAFYQRQDIREVIVPDMCRHIGASAFMECANIEVLTFLNSKNTSHNLQIDSWTFFDCDIHSLILPDRVFNVGTYSFSNNNNLEVVHVPDSLQRNIHFLDKCASLKELRVPIGDDVVSPSFLDSNITLHEGKSCLHRISYAFAYRLEEICPKCVPEHLIVPKTGRFEYRTDYPVILPKNFEDGMTYPSGVSQKNLKHYYNRVRDKLKVLTVGG